MLLAQAAEVAKTLESVGAHWGFAAWIVAVLLLGIGWGMRVYFYDVVKPESLARMAHGERLTKCVEVNTTDVALLKEHARANTEAIERIDRTMSSRPCLTPIPSPAK